MSRRPSPDTTVGANIRTRRKARGWSVRYAADRAGLASSTWSRIERGLRSVDNRFVLADIATALECSTADLTGQPAASSDPDLAVAHGRVLPIVGALMDTPLDEPPTVNPRSLAEVEGELELVRDLYRRCDYAAVSAYLPRLLAELHAYVVQGPDKGRALSLLAYLTHATALVLRDLGYPTDSWIAAERCREVAEDLEDPAALGVAGFTRAIAAMGCTGHRRAAGLAVRAGEAIDADLGAQDALEVAGMLHLCSALSLTGIKEGDEAAVRLDEAQQLAERTGETTAWDLFFGPTNVAFWRVSLGVDAGDPGEAVDVALHTNPARLSASPGRQVSFYTDTARGLARLRRDAEATRYLLTAERIAPQRVRSAPLVQETARGLLERAKREVTRSELAGLCERMGVPG
jgi:transcriptional regulator with XRE-family HTH domain